MVARKYLTEVSEDFENYAEDHYLPAIAAPDADDMNRLAGLRFVATRRVEGREGTLREIFTTRMMSPMGGRIGEACLEALLAGRDDPADTARFLARVATTDRPLPNSKLCRGGLERLGSWGHAGLLAELGEPHGPKRLLALARLLVWVSGVSSPEPLVFWKKAGPDQRAAALADWRAELDQAGLLPPVEEIEEVPWYWDEPFDEDGASQPDQPSDEEEAPAPGGKLDEDRAPRL